MFGFLQWDSPLALLLEALLSLLILAVLVIVAVRVNARSEAERRSRSGDRSNRIGTQDEES